MHSPSHVGDALLYKKPCDWCRETAAAAIYSSYIFQNAPKRSLSRTDTRLCIALLPAATSTFCVSSDSEKLIDKD